MAHPPSLAAVGCRVCKRGYRVPGVLLYCMPLLLLAYAGGALMLLCRPPYSRHSAPDTLCTAFYTPHRKPYNRHPTLYILHRAR
jgi:hypothetical protein